MDKSAASYSQPWWLHLNSTSEKRVTSEPTHVNSTSMTSWRWLKFKTQSFSHESVQLQVDVVDDKSLQRKQTGLTSIIYHPHIFRSMIKYN